jgi:hypothetical protein
MASYTDISSYEHGGMALTIIALQPACDYCRFQLSLPSSAGENRFPPNPFFLRLFVASVFP